MDAIKIKMEEDPLNIEAIDNTSIEDTKPLPEDGNMFGQDVTGIKTESVDDSYDPTLEEAQEPINVCAVKYEAEEQSFDLVTVKEEVNVGTEPEEDEVLTDSIAVTQDISVSSHYDRLLQDEHVTIRLDPNNCDSSEKPASDCHNFEECFTREDSIQTQSRSDSEHTDAAGKSTFKCDICKKVLSTSFSLRRHLQSHIGVKPFKCDICGKSFSDKVKIRGHMHQHTGNKPFECNVCGKFFTRSDSLKVHAHLHKCNVCGRHFHLTGELKIHARMHKSEDDIKCHFCGKHFAEPAYLKVHSYICDTPSYK